MNNTINQSETRWENLLSTLSPNKINALEKSLKEYQKKLTTDMPIDEYDNDGYYIKPEPIVSSTSTYMNHKTKNRGLTYENGRRNLKSENCSPEETERRAKRRERNRLAAAKCREKRQMQVDELYDQVNQLRDRENQLHNILSNLKSEENQLKNKLNSHNCVVTETPNGDISLVISRPINNFQNNNANNNINNNNNYNSNISCNISCRPKSLPLDCQNCTSNPKISSTTMDIDCFDTKTPSLDQLFSKDEFTPLLSPDTFSLLKGQIKTEPEDVSTPTKSSTDTTPATLTPLNNVKPTASVLYNPMPQPITRTVYQPNHIRRTIIQQPNNNVFSWNNNVVDNLTHNCCDINTNNNTTFLTTPTVDIPCYNPQNNYY